MEGIQGEINYYKSSRKEFLTLYNGMHLVIKGQQVIGVYKSNSEAFNETIKLHAVGTFIIEHPLDLGAK